MYFLVSLFPAEEEGGQDVQILGDKPPVKPTTRGMVSAARSALARTVPPTPGIVPPTPGIVKRRPEQLRFKGRLPTAEETAHIILQIKNVSEEETKRRLRTSIAAWNFDTPVSSEEESPLSDAKQKKARLHFPNYSEGNPVSLRRGHPLPPN
jgi:hypothetical protein